jgi:hypothetical protein
MTRLGLFLLLIAAATGPAHAESAPSVIERAPTGPFAIAVNTPLLWNYSFAASGWVGWNDHHAIRANVARYRSPGWMIIPAKLDADDGPWDADFGHTTDLGLGWVYYPRRVLDGATLEAGVLCRIRRLRSRLDENNVAHEERDTGTYGGRLLAGWTWRLSDLFFLSAAVGASVGYERGTEKTSNYGADPMTMHRRVSRADVAAEGYLRIGASFGR